MDFDNVSITTGRMYTKYLPKYYCIWSWSFCKYIFFPSVPKITVRLWKLRCSSKCLVPTPKTEQTGYWSYYAAHRTGQMQLTFDLAVFWIIISQSLRAGTNPPCVYHTIGTTAGWSVGSRSWTGLIHMEALCCDVTSFGFPPIGPKDALMHIQ